MASYEFENCKVEKTGIRYSRYIASWVQQTGWPIYVDDPDLEAWLKSEGLTKDEIIDLELMATTGKFELDQSLKKFIKEHNIDVRNLL